MATKLTKRTAELKTILEERRRQLTDDMLNMMRSVRARGGDDRDVADAQDVGEADVQDDLELALIQMKAETLRGIEAALRRLEAGTFGDCAECGQPIHAARLRALPFAVRCTDCEDSRERRTTRGGRQNGTRAYPNRGVDGVE
jgi:DnaK suppressor protein